MLGSLNYGSLVLLGKNAIQAMLNDKRVTKRLDDSLESLRALIKLPPQFGPNLEELLRQIDNIEQFTDEIGRPIVGNVVYLGPIQRR